MSEEIVIRRPGAEASIMGKLGAVGCIIRRPEAEVSVTSWPEAVVSVKRRLEDDVTDIRRPEDEVSIARRPGRFIMRSGREAVTDRMQGDEVTVTKAWRRGPGQDH